MARVLIEETNLTNIANAIRGKTGKTDLITPPNMASEIEGIVTGGGIDETFFKSLLEGSITELTIGEGCYIRQYGFYRYTKLTKLTLSQSCYLNNYAFSNCTSLKEIRGRCNTIGQRAFESCTALVKIDLDQITMFSSVPFSGCTALKSLVLRQTTSVPLTDTGTYSKILYNLPNVWVYVPSSMIDTYKASTYWKSFASQFRALEDYTVDGTITGELDETKI